MRAGGGQKPIKTDVKQSRNKTDTPTTKPATIATMIDQKEIRSSSYVNRPNGHLLLVLIEREICVIRFLSHLFRSMYCIQYWTILAKWASICSITGNNIQPRSTCCWAAAAAAAIRCSGENELNIMSVSESSPFSQSFTSIRAATFIHLYIYLALPYLCCLFFNRVRIHCVLPLSVIVRFLPFFFSHLDFYMTFLFGYFIQVFKRRIFVNFVLKTSECCRHNEIRIKENIAIFVVTIFHVDFNNNYKL